MARLAGAPAFQISLYVVGIKLHAWRAAVDNTAERDAVAFAKRRHDKILSNTIARHQGLFTLLWWTLPVAIFSPGKAEKALCSTATQVTDNKAGGEMAPALRVIAEILTPPCSSFIWIYQYSLLAPRLTLTGPTTTQALSQISS